MQAEGLAAFGARKTSRTAVYSFEQDKPAALTALELRAFKSNKAAWTYFESAAPSYRKTVTHWITTAKQATTRARRLGELIDACAAGRRLGK
jgi:uncharacterized protein YdeI (YjbR/CyaY-like superfamily)